MVRVINLKQAKICLANSFVGRRTRHAEYFVVSSHCPTHLLRVLANDGTLPAGNQALSYLHLQIYFFPSSG